MIIFSVSTCRVIIGLKVAIIASALDVLPKTKNGEFDPGSSFTGHSPER